MDVKLKKPDYLQTWFIAFLFSLWFLVIPLIAGIILIIMQSNWEKKQNEAYKSIDDVQIYLDQVKKDCDLERGKLRNDLKQMNTYLDQVKKDCDLERDKLRNDLKQMNTYRSELKTELEKLEGEISLEYTTIPEIDETITSEEYRSKYSILSLKEKEAIKNQDAIEILDSKIAKKILNNDIRQLTRCFNSETDTHIRSITVKNIESVKTRIVKTFETLNKLFETDGVRLKHDLLEIKLEEADLMYSCEYQKEQERMQQKAIREQMVEEEKVRREIERRKAEVEKEEKHFHNEIDKLMARLQAASDVEKQLYVDKIKELEEKLRSVEEVKKDVLEREKNTRAGYVYIISNIGSFGENVYKIGMTRRLEPMDRVNELGSASVPFEFDVHAMIFSEDAPTLEATLHRLFDKQRVNLVNPRKEFFRVSLAEIEKAVKENFNATVQFTRVAEAAQFRESQRLVSELTVAAS